MKWIDLPPAWLLGCIAVAWLWRWPDAWMGNAAAGLVCLGIGAVLTTAAVWEFRRSRTTIMPRRSPSALITRGIFRVSRNPIYLADLFFLAGFSLIFGSVPGLVLVPLYAWLLQARFIEGEEARLVDEFGPAFEAYCRSTRRWL